MDTRHAILVPLEGLIAIIHSEAPIDIRALLEEKHTGTYVSFDLNVDDRSTGKFAFLVNEDDPPNERAREILVLLSAGVHMVLTGPVVFLGLPAEILVQVLRDFA